MVWVPFQAVLPGSSALNATFLVLVAGFRGKGYEEKYGRK
jgi:hypothetical protein